MIRWLGVLTLDQKTILGIAVPSVGQPVDEVKMRRSYRPQAADCHPDKTDDPIRHANYHRLSDACQVIKSYNHSLKEMR